MKKTLLFVLLFFTQFAFAQKVSFEIIKDKTEIDNIGAVILYVDVINESEKDIVILKPATGFDQKWRFYNVDIECADMPIWEDKEQTKIAYIESDLLVIPAKSKVEIIINGRKNANMLACDSKKFILKLTYDASELIKNAETNNCNLDEIKIVKKLTPIKIESEKTNIAIN